MHSSIISQYYINFRAHKIKISRHGNIIANFAVLTSNAHQENGRLPTCFADGAVSRVAVRMVKSGAVPGASSVPLPTWDRGDQKATHAAHDVCKINHLHRI